MQGLIVLVMCLALAAATREPYTEDIHLGYQGQGPPQRVCHYLGEYLPHPTDDCFFLRCDYADIPWQSISDRDRVVPRPLRCPPGLAVDRTIFRYPGYLLVNSPCVVYTDECDAYGDKVFQMENVGDRDTEVLPDKMLSEEQEVSMAGQDEMMDQDASKESLPVPQPEKNTVIDTKDSYIDRKGKDMRLPAQNLSPEPTPAGTPSTPKMTADQRREHGEIDSSSSSEEDVMNGAGAETGKTKSDESGDDKSVENGQTDRVAKLDKSVMDVDAKSGSTENGMQMSNSYAAPGMQMSNTYAAHGMQMSNAYAASDGQKPLRHYYPTRANGVMFPSYVGRPHRASPRPYGMHLLPYMPILPTYKAPFDISTKDFERGKPGMNRRVHMLTPRYQPLKNNGNMQDKSGDVVDTNGMYATNDDVMKTQSTDYKSVVHGTNVVVPMNLVPKGYEKETTKMKGYPVADASENVDEATENRMKEKKKKM